MSTRFVRIPVVRAAVLLGAALATQLAACSFTPLAPEAPAVAAPSGTPAAKKSSDDDRDVITGSRIPSKTTDRLLKTVGTAGAKEMARDRPPEPGPISR